MKKINKPKTKLVKGTSIEAREVIGGEQEIPFLIPIIMKWRKYEIYINITPDDAQSLAEILLTMVEVIKQENEHPHAPGD